MRASGRPSPRAGNGGGEFHNRRKDGSLFWESALIAPIKDADGLVTHFLAVKEDITDRKRAEEQLRLTQFTMDCSAEAVYWLDRGGRFLYVNHAAVAQTGYAREELLAMTVFDLDTDETPARFAAQWAQLGARGRA